MVIDQINIDRIPAVEPEHQPPVTPRPLASAFALQWVKPVMSHGFLCLCVSVSRLVIVSQHPPGLGQGDHERHGFDGQRPKAKPLIESLGLGRDRMHEDGADADVFARR